MIYNGLDDFLTFDKFSNLDSNFIIGYVGSFYYSPDTERKKELKWYRRRFKDLLNYTPRTEQWLYRSPYFFIRALSLALKNNPKLRGRVSFEYIGEAPSWFINMIKANGLGDIFLNHGFKDKRDVLSIQNKWSAILATSEKIKNSDHFCLPSKLFDVVETRKRILAFVTSGTQKNFLRSYPQTVFFNPDSIEENSRILEDVINDGSNYKSLSLDREFTRYTQSLKILDLLNQILNNKYA